MRCAALLTLLLAPGVVGADPPRYFVPGRAFEPLAADPRWPSFNIGYAAVVESDGEVYGDPYGHLWPVSFGDTIAFYRSDRFEAGAQAALFAVFDLEAVSQPLINADYQGGVYAALRRGDWSGLVRVYHQSSHLGDELLLRGPAVERDNTSHDAAELLVARDLLDGDLRLYGGGGWVFHETGRDRFGDLVVQYGAEYLASRFALDLPRGLTATPLVAADVQHLDGRDFQLDLSAVAGLRFDGPGGGGHLDVTLTYYDGRNPNGQFFVEDVETVGVNVRLTF